MNWSVERDNSGLPVRMVYMGHLATKKREPVAPPPGCPCCGFHFGWHKRSCENRGVSQPGEKP